MAALAEIPRARYDEPGVFGWTKDNALVTYLAANTASHYRFARRVLKRWARSHDRAGGG